MKVVCEVTSDDSKTRQHIACNIDIKLLKIEHFTNTSIKHGYDLRCFLVSSLGGEPRIGRECAVNILWQE